MLTIGATGSLTGNPVGSGAVSKLITDTASDVLYMNTNGTYDSANTTFDIQLGTTYIWDGAWTTGG